MFQIDFHNCQREQTLGICRHRYDYLVPALTECSNILATGPPDIQRAESRFTSHATATHSYNVSCVRYVRCYICDTVFSHRGRQPSSRSIIAITAVLWLLVAGIGEQERASAAAPDAAVHTVAASLGKAVAVNADHTRADHGSLSAGLKVFTTAVDPRWATTPAALGMLAVVATAAALFADRVPSPGRGPPCGFSNAQSGQDLLTRLCLSRR